MRINGDVFSVRRSLSRSMHDALGLYSPLLANEQES